MSQVRSYQNVMIFEYHTRTCYKTCHNTCYCHDTWIWYLHVMILLWWKCCSTCLNIITPKYWISWYWLKMFDIEGMSKSCNWWPGKNTFWRNDDYRLTDVVLVSVQLACCRAPWLLYYAAFIRNIQRWVWVKVITYQCQWWQSSERKE